MATATKLTYEDLVEGEVSQHDVLGLLAAGEVEVEAERLQGGRAFRIDAPRAEIVHLAPNLLGPLAGAVREKGESLVWLVRFAEGRAAARMGVQGHYL